MEILLNVLLLIIGFVILIKSADFFVDGASSIAGIFKVPAVVVGLTIVAFGTSAPEAAVSTTAALSGSNAIAVSNIIGSNIFNLLLVLGATALLAIVPVPRSIADREFPFLLVISILMLIFIYTGFGISRIEGIIFLFLLAAYVINLIMHALKNRLVEEKEEIKFSLPISIVLVIGGITGVIIGGDLVVNNASDLALALGWSEKLVGLTIVSLGTSLPELVTSLQAARKNQVEIAIGNVVGSNVFNILFILGLSTTISPISVEPALMIDLIFMVFATLLTYGLCRFKEDLSKKDGLLLILFLLVYMVYIFIRN